MNNDLMFSSKSEMWETPQAFFDDLNNLFQFTLDACATPENAKCERYFTPEMDGLKQAWDGVVWCNPPYGRGVGAWVEKAHRTAEESDATVVMLLPARTDTAWFHDYCYNDKYATINFVRGRLKFGGEKNSAPFPSMVVIFRRPAKSLLSRKTRQSVFLEQWPNAWTYADGVLSICPNRVADWHRGTLGTCISGSKICEDCRREFWSQEVE